MANEDKGAIIKNVMLFEKAEMLQIVFGTKKCQMRRSLLSSITWSLTYLGTRFSVHNVSIHKMGNGHRTPLSPAIIVLLGT